MTEPDPASDQPEPAEGPEPADATRYEIVPHFTPVPREMKRHNGWSPDIQRRFVEALAETGSVSAAARTVGRAQRGAYELRRHPQAEEFRRAWDAALDIAVRLIEAGVMDRAINGVQVPVYSKGGELIGYRTVHNERVTTFMLQQRLPARYGGLRKAHGAKGDNAVDKMEQNRLKKRWREEWERDHGQQSIEREQQNGETMVEHIEARHIRWWSHLSPRAKEAYLQFRRIESEDRDCYDRGEPFDLDAAEAALDDYDEAFGDDDRAKIDLMIEADGLGDDKILGEDLPPPPPGRTITLKDGGWVPFDPRNNDGRAKPWP